MQLIQILLPLYQKDGKSLPASLYEQVKNELTQKFGGLTAYTRSPASGTWKNENDKIVKDDIYIFEVMADDIDKSYWVSYKNKLLNLFQQEELVIRATEITLL